jgi:GTPase SAR1 family protein
MSSSSLFLDSEEAKFSDNIKESIRKGEKIKQKLANAIVVGATGSGKSSFMDRILHRKKRRNYTSTPMADAIVVVNIKDNPSSFHVVDGDTWEEMDYEQSIMEQIRQPKSSSLPKKGSPQPESEDDATPPSPNRTKIEYMVIPLAKKYGGVKKFMSILKKNTSLYLRDTGGQVEFQEMLPLLVFGPSLFLFVLRLDLDFNKCFHLEYRGKDKSMNSYTSSITTKQALLQSLASIKAMDPPQTASVKTHNSIVFIVGTHKESPGSTKEKIAELNIILNTLIEENGYSDLVEPANRREGEIMFTVDNKADGDEDFAVIRSRISNLIKNHDHFTIEFPISYLLFSLNIQTRKCNVLSIQECREIAELYGIVGEEELKNLLDFLHLRVGVIQHFDIEGVSHIVVKEPQVLFNVISDLIIETFSNYQDNFMSRQVREFEKGILSLSAFKSVVGEGDDIPPKEFLRLLSHLRIIAPLSQSQNEDRYFVPCVLNHVPTSSREDETKTGILPLTIKFECSHTPKGLFGVLITHLMSPVSHDDTTFTLMEGKIFKDQVSFEVLCPGEEHMITLKAFSSHLEVFFYPELSDSRSMSPIKACSTVCKIIESSIFSSLADLHYNKEVTKPILCLPCPCPDCPELHPVDQKARKVHCKKPRRRYSLTEGGMHWFDDGVLISGWNCH